MTRPTITVAIIAQDEERRLPGLLDRLGWADEIVLVDGGSLDRTPAIAAARGCRVQRRAFDDFAAQRNHALELAGGDWILAIDADERPARGFEQALRRAVEDRRFAAYRVPIRSTIFGYRMRHGGTQDDRPARLFRRGAARWRGGVHERLDVDGRVGTLAAGLDHHTIPGRLAFLRKMERYTSLAAAGRLKNDCRPRALAAVCNPLGEVFRRLVWKQGLLDGPAGWAFCILSGYSEWVLQQKHRRLWSMRTTEAGRV